MRRRSSVSSARGSNRFPQSHAAFPKIWIYREFCNPGIHIGKDGAYFYFCMCLYDTDFRSDVSRFTLDFFRRMWYNQGGQGKASGSPFVGVGSAIFGIGRWPIMRNTAAGCHVPSFPSGQRWRAYVRRAFISPFRLVLVQAPQFGA